MQLFSKTICSLMLTGLALMILSIPSKNLNAQTGISLHTRHVLNSNDEIRLRDYQFTSRFLGFQGVALSIFRSREKKLFEFTVGFNVHKGFASNVSNTPEYFAQIKIKMFKNLFTKPQTAAYFSIGPRLFFMNGSIEANDTTEFSSRQWKSGVEVPIVFNFEHYFNDRIRLLVSINVLSPVLFADRLEVDDFSLTKRQRNVGGVDANFGLFNEMRLGVGYLFSQSKQE